MVSVLGNVEGLSVQEVVDVGKESRSEVKLVTQARSRCWD